MAAIQMALSVIIVSFFITVVYGVSHNKKTIGNHDEVFEDIVTTEHLNTKDFPNVISTVSEEPLVSIGHSSTQESASTFRHDDRQPSISTEVDKEVQDIVSVPNDNASIISRKNSTSTLSLDSQGSSSSRNEKNTFSDNEITGSLITQNFSPDMTDTATTIIPDTVVKDSNSLQTDLSADKFTQEKEEEEEMNNADLSALIKPQAPQPQHVIDKDGVRYIDIGTFNRSFVELRKMTGDYVITAGHHHNKCNIETLVMLGNYTIDKNITNCKSLRNVTLSGGDWICGDDWSWLEKLRTGGGEVNSSLATCADIRRLILVQKFGSTRVSRQQLPFDEGRRMLQQLGIEECPKKCQECITILVEEKLESHKVECTGSNITDEEVPFIPTKTTQLYLAGNKLQSTSKLFSKLEHLNDITVIVLDSNQLDALPYLNEDSFKKLEVLSLGNNSIRELNVDALKTIVSRRSIVVNLKENNFVCDDCKAHFFMKVCLENVTKIQEFLNNPLRCMNEKTNETGLIVLRDDECEPPAREPINLMPLLITVLAGLNILFIYLVYDLIMAIRECRGHGTNLRDPKLHVILTQIDKFLKLIFGRNQMRREEGEIEGSRRDLQNVRVTLRNNPITSADRDSCVRRPDRSRLTPRPN